jgi:hypothetical protein
MIKDAFFFIIRVYWLIVKNIYGSTRTRERDSRDKNSVEEWKVLKTSKQTKATH